MPVGVSDGVAGATRQPAIRKARLVIGNALRLRNVVPEDAGFLVALRNDEKNRRYLSITSPEIAKQVAWLVHYATDDTQAYFVVETVSGEPMGSVRIYDPRGDRFCFGSWVMRRGAPVACAVESVLITYRYALDELGFNRSHYTVRKPNRSVWQFMERFGGRRVGETNADYLYETDRESVERSFARYARFLPRPIQVIRDPVP